MIKVQSSKDVATDTSQVRSGGDEHDIDRIMSKTRHVGVASEHSVELRSVATWPSYLNM